MRTFRQMLQVGKFIPAHVKPWMYWMQLMLFVGPVLFVGFASARYLLASQILNAITAFIVFSKEGATVSRLFGVGHVFWLIPLWFFAQDVRSDEWVVYRGYAALAAATIAISLIFDARDVFLWFRGDRASILVGQPTYA